MRIIRAIYYFFRSDIPQGIGNLVRFFPVVWQFRPWDYAFNLAILLRSLRCLLKTLDESGMEVDETRIPRVEAIDRVVILIGRHNNEVLGWEVENQEWAELWKIVSGDKDIPGSDMRGWWD